MKSHLGFKLILIFVLYDAMQKKASYIAPRGYIEGGYYFFTRPSSAGIIRMRVLFEGGSYMRKYGKWNLQ